MSRTVRGRIVAVLAAYALALQPITAAAFTQGPHPGPVICSGVGPDKTPPIASLFLREAAAEFVPPQRPRLRRSGRTTRDPAPAGAVLTQDR
jgi:hypothetical protein